MFTKLLFSLSGQDAWYWGADISDSQLEGADGNIRAAGLVDKIELLKASVKGMSVLFPGGFFVFLGLDR